MSSTMDMMMWEQTHAALRPNEIAVVGSTEQLNNVKRTTLENLMTGCVTEGSQLPYEIRPANPTRDHIGSLASSQDTFLSAMHRVGDLVLNTIDELQRLSQILTAQPPSTGPGLYMVTNAGGDGVLTTDAAAVAGLEIIELDETIKERLNAILPAAWSHANPIDVLGDAKPDVYAKSVEAVMEHGRKGSALLVILSPQSVTEPDATAQAIADMIQAKRGQGSFDGPILCAWMGGQQDTRGRSILVEAGVPCLAMPNLAVGALAHMWKQANPAKGVSSLASKGCPSAKSTAQDLSKPALDESGLRC